MTSIDKLSNEYRQADLHPRDRQLVTDKEADAAFLKFRDAFWITLFFTMIIVSMLLVGVINQ